MRGSTFLPFDKQVQDGNQESNSPTAASVSRSCQRTRFSEEATHVWVAVHVHLAAAARLQLRGPGAGVGILATAGSRCFPSGRCLQRSGTWQASGQHGGAATRGVEQLPQESYPARSPEPGMLMSRPTCVLALTSMPFLNGQGPGRCQHLQTPCPPPRLPPLQRPPPLSCRAPSPLPHSPSAMPVIRPKDDLLEALCLLFGRHFGCEQGCSWQLQKASLQMSAPHGNRVPSSWMQLPSHL